MRINKVYHGNCLEYFDRLPQPDLIITDPPYEFQSSGGGIAGRIETFERIHNANLDTFDFYKYIPLILDLQKDRVNAYFFCNKALLPDYLNEAKKRKLHFDILTLNKVTPIPCKNSSYLPELEYIVFLRSPGVYWNVNLHYNLYFKSFKCQTSGVINKHPTQKPIALIRKYIKLSSKPGDLVLDPFLGSGTTALAAQQLMRNWIGFEIDEAFVKLANTRLLQTNLSDYTLK